MQTEPVLAIFVGGKSSRMGTAKGKLVVPGESQTIIEALVDRGREAGLRPVLVGNAEEYSDLVTDVPRIPDDPADAGPLGGLNAALRYAEGLQMIETGTFLAKERQRARVIVVGCDMPHITVGVLARLRDHRSPAAIVAPRRSPEAPWEPMLALYDASQLADLAGDIEAGCRSFQELFAKVEVEELRFTPDLVPVLEDWDTPEDVQP